MIRSVREEKEQTLIEQELGVILFVVVGGVGWREGDGQLVGQALLELALFEC